MITEQQKLYNNRMFKIHSLWYDYVSRLLNPIRREIVNLGIFKPGISVLDIACGTGTQAIALTKNGARVTGVDLSPVMLGKAKSKAVQAGARVNFLEADATSLPFSSESFNVAIISFALHDMPEEVRLQILSEAKRVVVGGGYVVLADYHTPKNRLYRVVGHLISSTFESKYYPSFLKIGLDSYLNKSELVVKSKKYFLFGNAQLVVCSADKLDNYYD